MLYPTLDERKQKRLFKFRVCRAHELNPRNSPNQLCHTVAVCVLTVHLHVSVYVCEPLSVCTYQTDA